MWRKKSKNQQKLCYLHINKSLYGGREYFSLNECCPEIGDNVKKIYKVYLTKAQIDLFKTWSSDTVDIYFQQLVDSGKFSCYTIHNSNEEEI